MPLPLDYASPPSQRRKPWLWIASAIVAALFAVTYFYLRIVASRRAGGPPIVQWYKSCASDAPPATAVAFDDVPVLGYPSPPDSVITVGWDGQSRRGRQPMYWFNLRYGGGWPEVWPDDPVLFLHELNRPAQPPRLVLVHARVDENRQRTSVAIDATLMQARFAVPRAAFECHGPVLVDLRAAATKPIRIYAGQVDPTNSAHFTIRYDLSGSTTTLNGWLKADPACPVGESIVFK
jgi:hypothetical protein